MRLPFYILLLWIGTLCDDSLLAEGSRLKDLVNIRGVRSNQLIGYGLELKNIVKQENIDNEIKYYVKSSTEKKIVPNFLIELDYKELDNTILLKGLKLVGDYLEKSILKPNNINYPSARIDFVNILK